MRDITDRLARRLRDRYDPSERVLAGVALNAEGTMGASLAGGAKASTGVPGLAADGELADVRRAHEAAGIEGVRFHLLLTDARLLLVRRNALGLTADTQLDVPVTEVAGIAASGRSHRVTIALEDGRTLELETLKAPKSLPPVYRQLPDLLAEAKSAHAAG